MRWPTNRHGPSSIDKLGYKINSLDVYHWDEIDGWKGVKLIKLRKNYVGYLGLVNYIENISLDKGVVD